MTHAEIRAAIAANGWQSKSPGEIADLLNAPRTEYVPTEIGIGTILDVLGLERGNVVLDIIQQNAAMRYVWGLLERGILRLDWVSVQTQLGAMVAAGVVLESEMSALLARAQQTATSGVTAQQVIDAIGGAA